MSMGDAAEEDEGASDWLTRRPISAALMTTRAARTVDRVRRGAVRAGSLWVMERTYGGPGQGHIGRTWRFPWSEGPMCLAGRSTFRLMNRDRRLGTVSRCVASSQHGGAAFPTPVRTSWWVFWSSWAGRLPRSPC